MWILGVLERGSTGGFCLYYRRGSTGESSGALGRGCTCGS